MKKIVTLVFATVMLLCALSISGCGGGDKFAGNWVAINPAPANSFEGSTYRQFKIEKNGDTAYIITQVDNGYRLHLKRIKGNDFWGNKISDFNFQWVVEPPQKHTATLQGNKLVVDGSATGQTFTYVEKDGSLLCSDQQILRKEGKEAMTAFKNDEQKRLQAMYDADQMGKYDAKEVNSLNFADSVQK